MKTLLLDLGPRTYPIHIGNGLFSGTVAYELPKLGKKVAIVTNDTIAPLYLQKMKNLLSGCEITDIVLPDGEQYKDLDHLNDIFTMLLQNNCNRDVALVALGGGVIGDMTGFAAACYQRGVKFVQVPTTLLAQVDSSVGGKTGVNHSLGKNMIGAFYQPVSVLIDTDTLDTLPERELSAGLAEVIKYGLIEDADFFSWLENNMEKLLQRDKESLEYAIYVSCKTKADIVARDERENGIRALLNLGHTFGHAIERGMGYGNWLHGEAVGAGMAMAADLSHRMDLLDSEAVNRTTNLIQQAGLPVAAPKQISVEDFLGYMSLDKKVREGKLHFVLLKEIGQALVSSSVSEQLTRKTLETCRV